MKNNLLRSTLAFFALCSALTLTATEIPVSEIPAVIQANGATVSVGTSRVMVSARLGSPSASLPDGSWLYSGYTAEAAGLAVMPNATLVVRFAQNKVTSLSLADRSTVTALRQSPRRIPANQLLAVR